RRERGSLSQDHDRPGAGNWAGGRRRKQRLLGNKPGIVRAILGHRESWRLRSVWGCGGLSPVGVEDTRSSNIAQVIACANRPVVGYNRAVLCERGDRGGRVAGVRAVGNGGQKNRVASVWP